MKERCLSQCIKMQAAKKTLKTETKNLKDGMPIFPIHNLVFFFLRRSFSRCKLQLLLFSSSFRASSGEPIIVFYFERKMETKPVLFVPFLCSVLAALGSFSWNLILCIFHVLKVCFRMVFI